MDAVSSGDRREVSSGVMRSVFGIAAALLAACSPPVDVPPVPELELKGLSDRVRAVVEQAASEAAKNPEDSQAAGKVGMTFHAHEEWEQARSWYSRAEALGPDEVAWPYLLAVVYSRLGDSPSALAAVRRALAVDSDYVPARLLEASLVFDGGDVEEAESLYRSLTETRPTAEAFYGLGRCLAARGASKEASAAFDRALEIFPYYGAALFAASEELRRQGWEEEAEQKRTAAEDFRETAPPLDDPYLDQVEALAVSAAAYVERAQRLAADGRLDLAAAALEEAAKADPSSPQPWINLIGLYAQLGRPDDAAEAYRRAGELNPNEAEAHFNYGLLMIGQDRWSEAKAALERAAEINPNDADTQASLGAALQGLGDDGAAAAAYRRALEQHPDHDEARFRHGLLLFEQGRFRDAVQELGRSLEPVGAATPQRLYAFAMAQGAAGDPEAAVESLQQAGAMAEQFGQPELAAQIAGELERILR